MCVVDFNVCGRIMNVCGCVVIDLNGCGCVMSDFMHVGVS